MGRASTRLTRLTVPLPRAINRRPCVLLLLLGTQMRRLRWGHLSHEASSTIHLQN